MQRHDWVAIVGLVIPRVCSEELKLRAKRGCPLPAVMLQMGGGLGSVGIPEDREVSMSSHGRLFISEG